MTFIIYVGLLVALYFLLYLGSKVKGTSYEGFDIFHKTKLTLFHWIALFIISIVVGFRYQVGTDWKVYKEWYDFYKVVPMDSLKNLNFEPGFLYLNYILADLGFNYTFMFFVVSLISWFFIFKSVNSKLLPVFIFFIFVDEYFFWSMNGVRQFISISIFIFSIRFIVQKDLKNYTIYILLAFLFHTSAIILFPLYFIPWGKLYRPGIWITIFLISFFLSNTPFLINSIESSIMNMGNSIPILSVYLKYFENGRFEAISKPVGLGYIFKTFVGITIFLLSKEVTEAYPKTKIYFVLFFFGSIVYNLFYMFPLIGRINLYFIFLRTITLSLIIYHFWEGKKYRPAILVLSTLYFILFLVTILNSSNDCCPYQFRFN